MLETLHAPRFLAQIEPFSFLEKSELEEIAQSTDIFYFKEGEKIAKKGETPERYFILAKGFVKTSQEGERLSLLGPKDSFEARALLEGSYALDFIAAEESLLFGIKKEAFLQLLRTHATFECYYLDDIAQKMDALLKRRSDKDISIFMATKIKECPLQKALIVEAETSILECAQIMSEHKADALIVKFEKGHGIITNTTLREKVILQGLSSSEPAHKIATPRLITMDEEEFLFGALLSLIEHNIQRLAITRGKEKQIVGILDQIDLLSSIASKGHLINFQIQKAQTVEELEGAAKETLTLIKTLQAQGVRTREITRLLYELNAKLYKRLFEILMPKELIENSALIVLGSEGRGEQTLRTDQDNALILRDGFEMDHLESLTQRFTDALLFLGFPPCQGGIMLSQTPWRRSLSQYLEELEEWIFEPSGERVMRFSILFDASCVGGDARLLDTLRQKIFQKTLGQGVFFARFALATTLFETPLSFFSNFVTESKEHEGELDIKKGAIFPLVHGIRSLALQNSCPSTNTLERIRELEERGVLSAEFAIELREAFEFLLQIKMQIQIEKHEKNLPADNYINPSKLGKFERDLLRDVFKITERFKKFITHHFKLNMVS